MQIPFPLPDINPAMPEIVLCGLALFVLMADLILKKKETVALMSIISLGITFYITLTTRAGLTFSDMFISDGFSTFFKLIFYINAFLSILISVKYIKIEGTNLGEYYSLILFSTLGMMIMASGTDLIVIYLGLELMAISTYVLAGFIRHEIRSNEAALKYFLLGAFSSAFLLYGISMIYGTTGTTNVKEIATYITLKGLSGNTVLLLSMILFTVAFGFKIAAVPFHMWAPDVYEGAPTSITAFMSVGPKAAGFAAMARVFMEALGPIKVDWVSVLIPISILTMAVGNIIALSQTNIKRMLAYSSIAHAGYMLLGLIAGDAEGLSALMSYVMIYAFMNTGAFAVVIMLRREGFKGENIEDFLGLAKSHPLASALMLIFMFSLTGLPPTAGFIGKFYLFLSAVNAGYTWLVVIAVIFSAISAYFYLRVVMYMYMKEPKEEVALTVSGSMSLALAITAIMTIILGVFPSILLNLAKASILI
ncbi:MAG: NADH-quinone oxidoreductase subunit N [Nitrospirae bacterium]|nr:NADH-quinone oxidoreductase subunit N [Nitrospirota bacterium]